ncbi:hypothetical protein K435DRAFT_855865, partial [Dendrothele bispora CBS 962.96]
MTGERDRPDPSLMLPDGEKRNKKRKVQDGAAPDADPSTTKARKHPATATCNVNTGKKSASSSSEPQKDNVTHPNIPSVEPIPSPAAHPTPPSHPNTATTTPVTPSSTAKPVEVINIDEEEEIRSFQHRLSMP